MRPPTIPISGRAACDTSSSSQPGRGLAAGAEKDDKTSPREPRMVLLRRPASAPGAPGDTRHQLCGLTGHESLRMAGDRSGQRLDRDDRDRRRRVGQRVLHPVERVERALDLGWAAGSRQVLGDRAAPGVVGGLCATGRRRSMARGAPVVEHARNLKDPLPGSTARARAAPGRDPGRLEALANPPAPARAPFGTPRGG